MVSMRGEHLSVCCTSKHQTAELAQQLTVDQPPMIQGTAPARSNGILVSHEQKLYMVGGHGSYPQGESLMMTCDSYTGCWEPVRYFGEEPIEGLADGCTGRFFWALHYIRHLAL